MQVMLVLTKDILNHFLVKEKIISSFYYYVSIKSLTDTLTSSSFLLAFTDQ